MKYIVIDAIKTSASLVKMMSEGRVMLCGHNKNASFLNEDGVSIQVRTVSEGRVMPSGHSKNVSFLNEDGWQGNALRAMTGNALRQYPK
ncbi:hypothetical protein TNCV_4716851 [Trichonephila clavipes]|nr:hypothetical protein TNCV_4716851 [Trichonephila clavipes]